MPDPGAVRVKICGLKEAEHVAAAAEAGAAYLGFVFYPRSPRHIDIATAARLTLGAPAGIARVALVVDADDDLLDRIAGEAGIDMIQLHGAESPERAAEVRARLGLPVMKALGVAAAADLERVAAYAPVCDQVLVDAKPPKDASALPGGNGLSFDWRLLQGRRWPLPWMLAGGLTPGNVADAVRLTGARQVDVSSGVEAARGIKDPDLIAEFVAAAQAEPVPVL